MNGEVLEDSVDAVARREILVKTVMAGKDRVSRAPGTKLSHALPGLRARVNQRRPCMQSHLAQFDMGSQHF